MIAEKYIIEELQLQLSVESFEGKTIFTDSPELIDYQIRIPRGGKTSALTEAIITWQVKGKRLQTIGIDSDQVLAAVNSTLKLLNLHLLQKESK